MQHDLVDIDVAARRQVAGHDLEREPRAAWLVRWIAPNLRQPVRSTVQPRVFEPGTGRPSTYSRSPMVTVVPGSDGRTQALVW